MKTLQQLLNDFDGTQATCVDDLTSSFRLIADRVLYGGHFEINDGTEIHPQDVEFYYFNENEGALPELNDAMMYHKGKNVPYFPLLSFYPHESGVDVTFENEDKHFRASFLIRAYGYVYHNPKEVGTDNKPRHLWEDMFGYHSIIGNGITIKWIDDKTESKHEEPESGPRVNLGSNKPWRFWRDYYCSTTSNETPSD